MKTCILCRNIYVAEESHHIIPKEYGGEEGPELEICPTCHATLHRCISNPVMLDEFLATLPTSSKPIALKLINAIKDAKVSGQLSDYVNLQVKIPRYLHSKLKQTSKDLNKSIKDLVILLLKKALGG